MTFPKIYLYNVRGWVLNYSMYIFRPVLQNVQCYNFVVITFKNRILL